MKDTHTDFLGTYFNKDVVLRISQASKILAWIVLAFYGVQLLLSIGTNIVQILQGVVGGDEIY